MILKSNSMDWLNILCKCNIYSKKASFVYNVIMSIVSDSAIIGQRNIAQWWANIQKNCL